MKESPFYRQASLLLEVLPVVGRHDVFALKGGTAINFFVRDLPRLSVDIDLAYLPITDREAALQDITVHLQKIKSDLEKQRYSVVPNQLSQTDYWNRLVVSTATATIKIEPNLVIRGSVFAPEKRPLRPKVEDVFECAVDILCLSKADLFGGKICAALDRQHPRDLFDVWLLLKNEGITDEIRQAFIVYLISHNRPMVELLDPGRQDLEHIYEQEFSGMTWQIVTLEELLAAREALVDRINSEMTAVEKRFLLSVKQGEPQWDLFGVDGIADLPAVQWKLRNIRNMNPLAHQQAVDKLKKFLWL